MIALLQFVVKFLQYSSFKQMQEAKPFPSKWYLAVSNKGEQ